MKSPQPFLAELQQRSPHHHEKNKAAPMMLESKVSFGKSMEDGEELPLARGVKLQDGRPDTVLRPSLTVDDLDPMPTLPSTGSSLPPPAAISPLPVSSSKRQESNSSDEFDGSITSEESSSSNGGGLYDSESSLLSTTKLYGRDKELQTLSQAYRRIIQRASPADPLEYVLISGAIGSGKTRLGESLRDLVAAEDGFFCYGKFDQFNMTHPLAPLCSAFTDYVEQVLARDESVRNEVRHRIRSAVDGDLKAIYRMIPPLATLMGMPADCMKQQECRRASYPGAQIDEEWKQQKKNGNGDCTGKSHSVFAMQRLMRAISTPTMPVVMIFDDLQWAPKVALDRIKAMVTDDMNDGIVFVGICHNDVAPTSYLSATLRAIEDSRVKINNIALRNLNHDAVVNMVNDCFVVVEEQANVLGKYILENSAGNPYLVLEILRVLQQVPGLLQYDNESEAWVMNFNAVCNTGCCPVDFIESKLRVIPRDMQKVFMVASCLGSNITPRLLEIALQENIVDRFDKLVMRGKFVFNKSRQTYSFKQNALQEASYRLIDESIRPGFHLEIGMRLWSYLDEEEVDEHIFLIVDQMRRGVELTDQSLRYELTGLVIQAAEKAVGAFNFMNASELLKFAFTLLGPNHWTEAYDLSLILYNYAAEVEFAASDSDLVDELLTAVLDHAKEFSDKIRAYSTQVYVLGGRGEMNKAIDIGVSVLEKLGVHLPKQCHKINTAFAMARIGRRLSGMSNERIKRIRHMTDPDKLAAMQILNLLFLNTNIARRELFPFVVLKMMKLSLLDGLSAISSVAFAGYASLLCYAGNVNEGLRYGKLALDLVEEFDVVSFKSRCNALVWGTIFPHVRPWKESLEQLKEGHRVGLQTGDTEFAMLNAQMYILCLVDSGAFSMDDMIATTAKAADLTAQHGHAQQIGILQPMLFAFKRFAKPDGDLLDHSGTLDSGLEAAEEKGNIFAASILSTTKQFLYFIAGDYDSALEAMDRRLNGFTRVERSVHESFAYYLEGLVCFAAIRSRRPGIERRRLLKHARRCMKFLKLLSRNNPTTCLAKYLLLEAEDAALRKKHQIAREKYNHAIALSKGNGSFLELAFANHVAAAHFQLDLHDVHSALEYFQAARETYEIWGGLAAVTVVTKKIDDLEKIRV